MRERLTLATVESEAQELCAKLQEVFDPVFVVSAIREAEKRGREQGREDAHLSDAWHEMQNALKYLKLVPMREDETEIEKETFQWLHHHLLTAIGNIEILMGFAEDERTPGSQNVT